MNNDLKKYGYHPIGIYVNDDLKCKIERAAKEKGLTKSTYVWLIIDEYIRNVYGG